MENKYYNYNKFNKNSNLTIEEETEYQITNEMLKDAIILNSSLGAKLLLENYKKDKEYLTKFSTFIRSNFGSYLGKTNITKVYYDTDELYFHKAGINICVSIDDEDKDKEIIIRYDSKIERISYLKFLPDTYLLKVKKNSKLSDHFDFIESAILQLITNGLQTDVKSLLKGVKPIITVSKKREAYKFNLPNKLIANFNFDRCIYTTSKNRDKYKVDMLEIVAENNPKEFNDTFQQFIKDLILDLPTLIRAKNSDLFIGLDYLLDVRD